ncbi:MAG TPA: hypothetical protein VKN74_02535 [Candidatus Mcinerneyibacterium sp.]|nr:hypothetical protein [Candidatus Mcinerneyibacterium sp.]
MTNLEIINIGATILAGLFFIILIFVMFSIRKMLKGIVIEIRQLRQQLYSIEDKIE